MILPRQKIRKTQKQLDFFPKTKRSHGGTLAIGRRKNIRPIDTRSPHHIILKSNRAKGKLSLVHHNKATISIIQKMAARFQVSIYERNVNFDHVHILARGKKRKNLQDFFRSIAALIAREVTGARKGKPFGKFWSYLIFSRIVDSGKKDFETTRNYIIQNELETLGLAAYKPRRKRSYG
jgi:REP element-mobilizing transposase RayT